MNNHEELEWLESDHWVKFNDNDDITEGFHPQNSNHIIDGVEQINMRRLLIVEYNGVEIWHKPGRSTHGKESKKVYEPAAFLMVKKGDEIIGGFSRYETIEVVLSGKNHKNVVRNLKAKAITFH